MMFHFVTHLTKDNLQKIQEIVFFLQTFAQNITLSLQKSYKYALFLLKMQGIQKRLLGLVLELKH